MTAPPVHTSSPYLGGSPASPSPEQSKGVTVEEIVSGTRCSPLTLKEFEEFLIHEERSVENLQFIVWYRSYCERFKALSPELQALSEPPQERFNAFGGSASIRTMSIAGEEEPWWSRLIRRRSTASIKSGRRGAGQQDEEFNNETRLDFSSSKAVEKDSDNISLRSAASPDTPVFADSRAFPQTFGHNKRDLTRTDTHMSDNASINTANTENRKRFGNLRFNLLSPMPTRRELPEDTPLPFLEEISLILTTFILPGSAKELNLDARLRRHILKSLQPLDEEGNKLPPRTTHPDVFKDAAEHAYALMERSLPHYLTWAKGNTNTPKMLFWTFVGFVDFMIGLMIGLVIMFKVHARGWRAFSFLFVQFGIMQAYSASKYFCSQVHGRTARQLYPWELTSELSHDELTTAGNTHDLFGNKPKGESGKPLTEAEKVKADLAAAMPFLFEDDTSVPMTSAATTTVAPSERPSKMQAIFRGKFFASMRGKDGKMVKTFGPERVVEDPYIKELHNKQMKEILWVGLFGMLAVEAILLAIPEQRPR